eukprot:5856773-Prymnesium_polylepis.1
MCIRDSTTAALTSSTFATTTVSTTIAAAAITATICAATSTVPVSGLLPLPVRLAACRPGCQQPWRPGAGPACAAAASIHERHGTHQPHHRP